MTRPLIRLLLAAALLLAVGGLGNSAVAVPAPGCWGTAEVVDSQTPWTLPVRGSCFRPGEKVDVVNVAHDAYTSVPAWVLADSNGNISFTIGLVPSSAPGYSNPVWLVGEQSRMYAGVGGVRVYGTELHTGQTLSPSNMLLISPKYGYQFDENACNPLIAHFLANGSSPETWQEPDLGDWRNGNCRMEISSSGNLVTYSDSGAVLWSTHTTGTSGGNFLAMNSDGNAVIYTGTHAVLWTSGQGRTSPPATAQLRPGGVLRRGHHISNGNTEFALLSNGNVVVLRAGQLVWSSRTGGRGGVALTMSRNGNLVLTNARGRVLWSTRTAGRGQRGHVIVGANGDVAIWSGSNQLVWHTNTGI